MRSSAGKIELTGFDDLFQTGGETVQEVPLSELFPFKDHPFQVRDDEAMQKTVDSIARSGVLSPGIVRPRPEGGYEIIAGHRRKRVSQYTCGQYGRTPVGTLCTSQHRISEGAVLDLISGMLRAIADFAKSDRTAFIREVQEAQASQQDSDIKKKKRRLTAAQKRAGELERLVCKIYEDVCCKG